MKTSDKISYEDIFSTDIDVIRRNIEFGTYTHLNTIRTCADYNVQRCIIETDKIRLS